MNKTNLNNQFTELDVDYLYHLGIDTSMNLKKMFGQIKYVVFTLSNTEAATIAREFAITQYNIAENEFNYQPLYKTERFHLYQIGVTLIISIGVGGPSLLIAMTEITKLLVHLECFDVSYFKLGFAHGIGVDPGTIIVSHDTLDAKFKNQYKSIECGNSVNYPLLLDDTLTQEFYLFCLGLGNKNITHAKCLSTKVTIEEQCHFSHLTTPPVTNSEVNNYLTTALNKGIRCIDMESMVFAGFCNQLEIKSSIISVTISNYLENQTKEFHTELHLNTLIEVSRLLANFIKIKK